MMNCSRQFSIAILAGLASAQTANISDYTYMTPTISSGVEGSEAIVTTSIDYMVQELINGDDSYTVINQLFNIKPAQTTQQWSTATGSYISMTACIPYTNRGFDFYYCQDIEAQNPAMTTVNVWYNVWSKARKWPQFNNIESLWS